jgi:hypothetical protein
MPIGQPRLDRRDVVDPAEALPESRIQRQPADGRLKVQTDRRYIVCNAAAVFEYFVSACALERCQAEQSGVVPQRDRSACLADRLVSVRPRTPVIITRRRSVHCLSQRASSAQPLNQNLARIPSVR